MSIELFVFDARPQIVDAVAGTGADRRADAIVVDWERSGKADRQRGAADLLGVDTQIAPDTPADLRTVVERVSVPVICRLDCWEGSGRTDLERAVEAGADEVLLPMVTSRAEVVDAIAAAAGRVGVGVMIETNAAVAATAAISALPITRLYLGLMDLAIERRNSNVFAAVFDGTLDHVASASGDVPFGFAGLTLPGRGFPIPTVELAAEMARVGAAFTFLRRSFLADAADDLPGGLSRIRAMVAQVESEAPWIAV